MFDLRQTIYYVRSPMKQLRLIKSEDKFYGGDYRNKRKGRGARPLATKHTMHMVLRSSKAVNEWSFRKHDTKIRTILKKFADKNGIRVISMANGGNHLHIHFKLSNRYTYRAFVRAITTAIMMTVTKMSRWNKLNIKFWDQRPFTRVVIGRRGYLTMEDYIWINGLEGQGYDRGYARLVVKEFRTG